MLKLLLALVASAALPPAVRAQPAPASAWTVLHPDTLPDDAFGRTVRYGRDLIVKTSSMIGPDAPDPAKRYGGNGLDCQSCHLRAGTQRFGLPLAGIWGLFPLYIARENEVRTLEERINGCMERSMNGRALPLDGAEMKAMLTFIRFISGPEQVGQALDGRGAPPLPLPEKSANPENGRQIFAQACLVCHGADGQGQRLEPDEAKATGRRYRYPPLWGPDSFNDGAGMARPITAAQFVHANMPFGTTFASPALSVADTFDVVAFVEGQPRPHKSGLDADFPDRSRKPVDAPYPPYAGPFRTEQHRLGPWPPIQAWVKENQAAAEGSIR
jgi:thiosulfate dehydrogenase